MPQGVREVNIKQDMPTADAAIRRLTYHLHTARHLQFAALKIIHGYGSSGAGGKIRTETRAYLSRQLTQKKLSAVIPGEQFSIFDATTQQLLRACPELRRDSDLDRHNNGITIVVL